MRSIDVSVDVFSLIWKLRHAPESSESEVLQRVLSEYDSLLPDGSLGREGVDVITDHKFRGPESVEEVKTSLLPKPTEVYTSKERGGEIEPPSNGGNEMLIGKVRWVDDVRSALFALGGEASLHQIYKKVENLRRSGGRSIPPTIEATIRRTLEDHCRESDNFRGVPLFRMPLGRGKGVWALVKNLIKKT